MLKPAFKKNLAVALISTGATLVLVEILLRIVAPGLGSDLFPAPVGESPFTYDEEIGYEPKPLSNIERLTRGRAIDLRTNSEGFMGSDRQISKPAGVFRIVAVGDSVVQALEVLVEETWAHLLERDLPGEVLNAGVGGYVSWQAVARLERRGLKYRPDLVLVLVGWNDMLYSTLPNWTPRMNLAQIEKAFAASKPGPVSGIKGFVLTCSYIARLFRQARNNIAHGRYIKELIAKRQIDSGLAFNEKALALYLENLERLRRLAAGIGSRLAVITWPTILSPKTLDYPEVHRRIVGIYSNFVLSTREIWSWYNRYLDAQRKFAAEHPDVLLVDAAAAFVDKSVEEKLSLFIDLAHLTPEGNRALERVILEALRK